MEKLSQTKRAKAMRKMRKNETPKEKETRLQHERYLYRKWQKSFALNRGK